MEWTDISKELKFEGSDETEEEKQARIIRAIEFMEWHNLGESIGMMQGMGINSAIRAYRIPKVSRVGESWALAPYGLYAITGHWADGTRTIYFIDDGLALTPVGSVLQVN
jgi:hypothetical protein